MPDNKITQTIYHDKDHNITILGEIDLSQEVPISLLVKEEGYDEPEALISCSPFMAEKLAAFFDRAFALYKMKWPDKVTE